MTDMCSHVVDMVSCFIIFGVGCSRGIHAGYREYSRYGSSCLAAHWCRYTRFWAGSITLLSNRRLSQLSYSSSRLLQQQFPFTAVGRL